jgi:uncharacterized protein
MSLLSRVMARMFNLRPAETHNITVERNLRVPMPDGVELLADHCAPRDLGVRPTLLVQSVYTNRTRGAFVQEMLAERGFQVLVVSGRGTLGSGGELDPFRQEHADGVAILNWLKRQSWFDGRLGACGASYLGYTVWAIAREAGPLLKAMSPQLVGSNFRDFIYSGDAFSLELFLFWMAMVDAQEKSLWTSLRATVLGRERLRRVARHLPLGDCDRMLCGRTHHFWQDWVKHDQPEDTWWSAGDNSDVSGVRAPAHLISGWYDFGCLPLLKDYAALRGAGHEPYLTIGPWTHFSAAASAAAFREGLIWMRTHLLGDRTGLRELPVRVFVMGAASVWRDFLAWPPPGMRQQHWYLQPGRAFGPARPDASGPDRYCYDPAHPTPAVGGTVTSISGKPVLDNRRLETRPDVMTYTSAPLEHDMELVGPVSAVLFVRSNLENADFLVRVCDVEPTGRSLNICDGIQRLFPGRPFADSDGCRRVRIELWPTAYRVARGHRLRVQVSSGAFPRWNRNLGTGEALATGTSMKLAEHYVYHDPGRASAVLLPQLQS